MLFLIKLWGCVGGVKVCFLLSFNTTVEGGGNMLNHPHRNFEKFFFSFFFQTLSHRLSGGSPNQANQANQTRQRRQGRKNRGGNLGKAHETTHVRQYTQRKAEEKAAESGYKKWRQSIRKKSRPGQPQAHLHEISETSFSFLCDM